MTARPQYFMQCSSKISVLCRFVIVGTRHCYPPAALVVATAICALLIAGCSNNPYPPGESAGSVLYTVQSLDYRTLDPTVSYSVEEASVVDCIYESYFKYHHLKQTPFVLELALGAAEPVRRAITISDAQRGAHAGEEWTFRIRKGLRFQDDPCFPGGRGREIVATDFVYSFRRMTDPALPCPVLSFFEDKVAGMDDLVKHNAADSAAQRAPDWATRPFPGVVADPADPYVFRVLLNQAYPQLRYLMAMHFTTPIPHEAVERYGREFARHPVGCGSFKMGEYLPKQRTVLVRNPNRLYETYPAEGDPGDRKAGLLDDAGRQLPLVDKVVFSFQKEPLSVWNLFQQGYLDFAGVSQNNYSQALTAPGQLSPEMAARGVRLREAAVPNIWYYGFNLRDPVWGGYSERAKNLRRAISLCIDRGQYIDVLLQGEGTPASFLLPPGIFGYEPNAPDPYSRTDVAEAKRLLAEAGYPDGIDRVTGQRLILSDDVIEGGVSERQAALFVKQQIERCGVQVNLQTWQAPAWEERVKRGGRTQFFRFSWYADYPDPENFLQLLYGGNIGGVNYVAYNNPEYNRLFEQMRGMSDSPARFDIIRRMRAIVTDDCPWIFNCHSSGYGLSYDWVLNNKPHGVANDGLRYVRVDGPRRAALQRAWNRPNPLPVIAALLLIALAALPAASTARARRNRSVRRRPKANESAL
jgi:oligopeptide transport system substrate-binding protein